MKKFPLAAILLLLCAACNFPTGTVWGQAARPQAFDEDHNESINGTTLHFRVRGANRKNPYLLILHGGPCQGSFGFYPWGALLEDKLNVVYLDQRGCGGSTRLKFSDPRVGSTRMRFADPVRPKPEEVEAFSLENQVRDAEGVREFLKIDKWYVLGHSAGGMLGLEYVVANQSHVLGYIWMDGLISVPLLNDNLLDQSEAYFRAQPGAEEQLRTIQKIRALPIGIERGFQAQAIRFTIPNFDGGPIAVRNVYNERMKPVEAKYHVSAAGQSSFETALAVFYNEQNHYMSRDDRPLLAKVRVPTLVIEGKDDHLITPAMAEIVHAGIKGSEILLLDDCGHAPYSDQPEKTSAAVLAYVAKRR